MTIKQFIPLKDEGEYSTMYERLIRIYLSGVELIPDDTSSVRYHKTFFEIDEDDSFTVTMFLYEVEKGLTADNIRTLWIDYPNDQNEYRVFPIQEFSDSEVMPTGISDLKAFPLGKVMGEIEEFIEDYL